MKSFIINSVLAFILIATILMIETQLPQMTRNILAGLAVIFSISYIFYNRNKPIKVKND
jgi:glycerol uptake facilitator-like aquaporin